ncbi:hypothetical protein BHM03_00059583 [Ensete ventricosum]|nr:hypothetical protein BHM03_00059583 [Ensete ventricosum]
MGPNEPPQKHEEEESDKIYEREAAARIRRTPRRSRGYVRRENTAACLTNTSNASTNGFSVRISGTYSVSGAAKNAVENRSCSIRAPPALPLSLSLSVERCAERQMKQERSEDRGNEYMESFRCQGLQGT